MTLQELSEYFKLREQLERDEETLISLRAAACPGAQALTAIQSAPGIKDKVGDLAVEIADMSERIRFLREEVDKKTAEVTAFVDAIESNQTRMIFRLRFLRGLTWAEVATVLGGGNTVDAVKTTCYRYLT